MASEDGDLRRQIDALTQRVREQEEDIGLLRLRLHLEAVVDGVTGLFTRNGILDAINLAQQRLARLAEPYAAVGLKLPRVEKALERASEDLCSDTARHFAALILAGVRGLDRVGRTRGLTFVLVLAGVNDDTASIVVNRLHSLCVSTPVGTPSGEIEPDPRFSIVLVSEPSATPDDVLGGTETSLGHAEPGRPARLTI